MFVQFAFATILCGPRFGWQPAPSQVERIGLYARVHEMGFGGIEWSPRWCDFDALPHGEIAALGQEVRAASLQVSGINLSRHMLSRCPEASDHRRRLLRAVPGAAAIRARRVIVSLSLPRRPSASRPRFLGQTVPQAEFMETADFMRIAARQAAEVGVELVMELHDDGLLDTPELCLRMLEAIDEPNVFINPDLGNLVRQPDSQHRWREALTQLAPHTGYWHVKNYRNGKPSPIWDGDIDYGEAVWIMRQAGFDGWVSIESYGVDGGDDLLRLQQDSLDWLRRVTGGRGSGRSKYVHAARPEPRQPRPPKNRYSE